MRIIAAPNAFKESLSAREASEAIQQGAKAACPGCDVVCIPVADGGDGLTDVMTDALAGVIHETNVNGPLLEKHTSSFGYVVKTGVAITETALASGLALLSEDRRNPMDTTSYGTGELILAAIDKGATRIIVGLGGSATCDGGIGMASAFGYRFLDQYGTEVSPIGQSLSRICSIDTKNVDKRIKEIVIEGVCDVSNPLTGENGASYIYSPQKGATEAQVRQLDDGLRNLSEVIKKDLGIDINDMPGAGAAGGLGAGLYCFLDAKLYKGIDLVMDLVNLRERIQGADLVITGEGQIDFQTKFDKAPAGVARIAKEAGIPCIAVCGSIGERVHELYDPGITSVFSLCDGPRQLDSAMDNGFSLLASAVEQVVRTFVAGRQSSFQ